MVAQAPDEKLLLLGIHRDGELVTDPMDESTLWYGCGDLLKGLDHTALAGDGERCVWKLTLNERGACAVECAMDLLLEAEAHAGA